MRKRLILLVLGNLLVGSTLSACLPRPDPSAVIGSAVAGTLTAWPTSTQVAPPTTTPPALAGLFCEYRFCIGHPNDAAFFDVSAQRNPASPSAYNQGILATYTNNLFIELLWQINTVNSDPQWILDVILEDGVDTRLGNLDVRLLGNLDVFAITINTSATPLLPYGGAAAWACGDRAFAWKAYTSEPARSETLLEEALRSFRCE